MSLLPNSIFQSPSNLISQISQQLTLSTLVADRIRLDGNNLDTTGSGGSAVLTLNGVAVASATALTSSIANWSFFNALSTINYDSNGGNLIMINGRFSNVSTNTVRASSITVSSINGQIVGGLGQSILYRQPTILSSQTINVSNPNRLILSFANPLSGQTVQGVWNGDFAGAVAVSNSGGFPPQMGVFISDNNVAPYAPTNALVGSFEDTFFPIGETNIGSFTGNMSNSVSVPFAFSNSPSVLNLIWAEQNPGGSTPSFAINNVSSSFLCVIGGGTPQAV
jgi:hypothetical protein